MCLDEHSKLKSCKGSLSGRDISYFGLIENITAKLILLPIRTITSFIFNFAN